MKIKKPATQLKPEKKSKEFVSLEQVNCHFFPKRAPEKLTTDGRKRGEHVGDVILADIAKILR